MKKINKYILLLLSLVVCIPACKDEDLEILPEWQTAVHGLTTFSAGSPTNFLKGDPSVELSFDMLWNSIDGDNTVEKIEIYALFNEAYVDPDGNPKTARHGGDEGILFATLEGAEVPANRETTTFTISQDDLFALYDGVTFDYDEDGTATPVWGTGSIKADRNTANRKFIDGDSFQIRWVFTTADGRVFDSWGISVCTEFPGANCAVNWAVVCSQVIANPPGDYILTLNDSYGDGWNGAAIKVVADGVGVDYTVTAAQGASAVHTVTIPDGTETLTFEFVSGDWDSEVTFTITAPSGNVIASGGPSPTPGLLRLDLCNEE